MRINKNKKKTEDYQLGGLSGIAEALKGIDWSNYESVLGKGIDMSTKMGGISAGIGFGNSILQDDPSIFENKMIEMSARNNAVQNIPPEILNNPMFANYVNKKIAKGTSRGVKETGQGYDQLAGLTGLLEMFQRGGMSSTPTPPRHTLADQVAEDESLFLGLKNTKKDRLMLTAILQDMGYGDGQGESVIGDYKKHKGLNVSPTKGADNTITKGLMQEIYKEFKQFQFHEGNLRQMAEGGKAILGYSDGSPFRNEKEIEIPGSRIDMSQTGLRLKLIPDVGKSKVAEPYSGIHEFPGATKIREVPIKDKGKKYFQEGGQGAVGAQLEDGEMFITPNLDIMYTAAKMLHKDMDKDHVTDVLGTGDYVISDMKKMKITRKQADDISFGMGGVLYEEGKKPKEPTELTAAKLFKEKEDELSLTEYAERIMKKFPVSKKDDVFGRKTTAANKDSRLPFVGAVIAANEKKRTGGGVSGFASTFENKFKSVVSADGNPIKKDGTYGAFPIEGEVPEMQEGGLFSIAAAMGKVGLGIANGVGQWIGAGQSYRDTRRALQADRGQINRGARSESQFSGLATGVEMTGYGLQSPYVESPQYDSTQLDASIRRVPRNVFDYTIGRIAAGNASFDDKAFSNARSYSDAVNSVGQNRSNGISSLAQLGMQEVQQNIGLENDYRNQKQAFSDRQILSDNTARNATRTNSNQLIAGAAGSLSGGIQSQGQIESNRLNALRQNDFAQVQAKLDRRGARQQAFANIAGSTSQGLSEAADRGLFGQQPPPGTNQNTTVGSVNNNLPQSYGTPPYYQQPYHGQYLYPSIPPSPFPTFPMGFSLRPR